MADTLTIAYRPELARLPDEQGKPVGTDAALLLSQAVWLSEHRADEPGWFEWTLIQCEEQTGLTRRQQQRLFPMLEALGYLKTDRRGENGLRHVRICPSAISESTKRANRKARNVQTETEDEKGKHETCKPNEADSTKRANRKARNVQTEAPAVSTQDTKTNSKTTPLYIPPNEGVKSGKTGFVPPTLDSATAFIVEECRGSIADAENFFDHFTANGWRVGGRTPMRDWKAAARKWARQSAQWEAERNARGSPVASRNGHGSHDMSLKQRADAMERLFEDL